MAQALGCRVFHWLAPLTSSGNVSFRNSKKGPLRAWYGWSLFYSALFCPTARPTHLSVTFPSSHNHPWISHLNLNLNPNFRSSTTSDAPQQLWCIRCYINVADMLDRVNLRLVLPHISASYQHNIPIINLLRNRIIFVSLSISSYLISF
jgi:hypothetical protein